MQLDFKAYLKLPASLCGRQVIDIKLRVTLCSHDMKTLKRNRDKTNFLLVYCDGLYHCAAAVFSSEQVCEQQQMASSEGRKQALNAEVYSTVTWNIGTNCFLLKALTFID